MICITVAHNKIIMSNETDGEADRRKGREKRGRKRRKEENNSVRDNALMVLDKEKQYIKKMFIFLEAIFIPTSLDYAVDMICN